MLNEVEGDRGYYSNHVDPIESSRKKWIHGLTSWMNDVENHGYKLFSMSITYKNGDFDHSPRFLCDIFKDMYWHGLLPMTIFNNKKWLKKHKEDQPYLFLFTEEHQERGIKTYNPKMDGGFEYVFPERFHHHAIIAVRPEHEFAKKSLCIENSLRQYSPWILTSDVKPADLGWVGYITKDLNLSSDAYEFYGPEKLRSSSLK
jgi:hypothetical protein